MNITRKQGLIAAILLCGAMLPVISTGEEPAAAPPNTTSQSATPRNTAPQNTSAQSSPTGTPSAAQPAKPAELVWPAPPAQPRIRYLGLLRNPDDLGRKKGFWRKVWETIRGDDSDEEIMRPMSVVTDSQDRVIVADTGRDRVHIFDRKNAEYSYIIGTGSELITVPIGLAVDARDNIYIASGAGKIYVFKPDGSFDYELDSMKWLDRPSGLAIDKKRHRLYIADTPSHAIRVYDLVERTLMKTIGEHGNANGNFNYPSHVAVDKSGRLYVTDAMNSRIQIFDADGQFLATFGKKGDGSGDFTAPKGVAVDSENHIYVADADFDNIQVFDQKSPLMFFGTAGQTAGMFWMPTGLFIDDQDRIYVADSYNNRIQIFQYLGGAAKVQMKTAQMKGDATPQAAGEKK